MLLVFLEIFFVLDVFDLGVKGEVAGDERTAVNQDQSLQLLGLLPGSLYSTSHTNIEAAVSNPQ